MSGLGVFGKLRINYLHCREVVVAKKLNRRVLPTPSARRLAGNA